MGPFNLGNPGEFTMLELAEVFPPYDASCICDRVKSHLAVACCNLFYISPWLFFPSSGCERSN